MIAHYKTTHSNNFYKVVKDTHVITYTRSHMLTYLRGVAILCANVFLRNDSIASESNSVVSMLLLAVRKFQFITNVE